MAYQHGRRDRNHVEIREGLRQCGFAVLDLGDVGSGCPDLLVCSQSGNMTLVEVKMPGERLTEAERLFFATWPGQCVIATRIEEIVMMLRIAESEEK